MNEYTPSTAEVRDGWVCLIFDGGACEAAKLDSNWSQDRAEAQFDRWLAEVERAAAEKAWDDGASARRDIYGDVSEENPYLQEEA